MSQQGRGERCHMAWCARAKGHTGKHSLSPDAPPAASTGTPELLLGPPPCPASLTDWSSLQPDGTRYRGDVEAANEKYLEWIAQKSVPAPSEPGESAEQWFRSNYRNVDPCVFIAQPSGKRLYVWEIIDAYMESMKK